MSEPAVVRTREDLSDALAEADTETAVVMTLGALHEGHAALMRAARDLVGDDGLVIVTIFVNPLQFGPGEDLDRYPRTLDADLKMCAAEGVDLVFAPDLDEMYPSGAPMVTVDPGRLGRELEGAARPDHFAGVLTVVAKLLNLTVPTFALFGEKDYQQLTLVRRMVTDLELPYEIVAVPTVREPDGLALSSRNRYLSADERPLALALSAALRAGRDAAANGRDAVLRAARIVLDRTPELDVDYLELRTTDLAEQAETGEARLLIAARLGTTRLIDNVLAELPTH
ncbi:pantoate--beta-alanine ligase [Phytoactinopolyspora alkaliphila]|uniref:pantoate--beta-alanine ligase n=1 Tax=Phytoactinopolyspora alkaliphila TaxID=1783498 RepID=UPI001C20621D